MFIYSYIYFTIYKQIKTNSKTFFLYWKFDECLWTINYCVFFKFETLNEIAIKINLSEHFIYLKKLIIIQCELPIINSLYIE